MKSQGSFSFLLMVLFVFDTLLIDDITASCQDHSRPYGVDWVNHWDRTAYFNCGRGKSISRIKSVHRNCIEDRLWSFSCEANAAAKYCFWTSWLNDLDGDLDYICPHNGFITGIYSWHRNWYEDRRFQFRCCHNPYYTRVNCQYSMTTALDDPFTYNTHHGYYLAGAYSTHYNYYEDRKWRFYSCQRV